jgi:hypothetical protein
MRATPLHWALQYRYAAAYFFFRLRALFESCRELRPSCSPMPSHL